VIKYNQLSENLTNNVVTLA